ncbi:uncharacterized protein V1516DRAFT_673201 [Lipomyces oligophaga]|uniref:uncharacterized protein n=1 Tax=Lipomyces oligophaga TaxID=45792 RepID=UPI0034CF6688
MQQQQQQLPQAQAADYASLPGMQAMTARMMPQYGPSGVPMLPAFPTGAPIPMVQPPQAQFQQFPMQGQQMQQPLYAQGTGYPGMMAPQQTGMPPPSMLTSLMMPQTTGQPGRIGWAITKSEKKIFDDIFDAWDGLGRGFVSGQTAVEIMGQSQLPRTDLEKIWTLSDPEDRGRLNRSEFSVAMHLVYRRLNGFPVPDVLPPELVPPSTRNLSESVSAIKDMLKSDADSRRGSGSNGQQSYLKARSFRDPDSTFVDKKKDATVYKNNDDDVSQFVSSSRHRSSRRNGTGSPAPAKSNESGSLSAAATDGMSKSETLDYLRKQVREKKILIAAVDAEDDLAYNEDRFLDTRDRDEADDLIRRIRNIQEDIDEYPGASITGGGSDEKASLRGQIQFLTDRLPVLVGRARGLGNKIADAKLELFRLRDSKAHPGSQIIGTGPGGRVTEADRRKARSLALLQARMAALTGQASPEAASVADDEHGAELRLATESTKINEEKAGNEKMIRDVEDGVREVQESIESRLRESREDFKVSRERQMFEEGVGLEDEVGELVRELVRRQRHVASSGGAASRSNPGRVSSSLTGSNSNSSSSGPIPLESVTGGSATSSSSAAQSAGSGTAASSSSFYAQFKDPEERAAWIKAEAERRMNERLAALGISRSGKSTSTSTSTTSSSNAFSAPAPAQKPASSAFSAPAPSFTTSSAFSPPAPSSSVSSAAGNNAFSPPAVSNRNQLPPSSTSSALAITPSVQASANDNTNVFDSVPKPTSQQYSSTFSAPPGPSTVPTAESSAPLVSSPAVAEQTPVSAVRPTVSFRDEEVGQGSLQTYSGYGTGGHGSTSRNPFPVVDEERVASTEPSKSVLATTDVSGPSVAAAAVGRPTIPFSPPPAVANGSSTTIASNEGNQFEEADYARFSAQRQRQRGGDDDDGWSAAGSEESSDDDGPAGLGGGVSDAAGRKPTPGELASMLFGSMAPAGPALPSTPAPTAIVSVPAVADIPAAPLPVPDVNGTAEAPAPPPPPPVFGAPMPPPPPPGPIAPPIDFGAGGAGGAMNRGALLEQIAAGRALKKVSTVEKGTNTGGHVL